MVLYKMSTLHSKLEILDFATVDFALQLEFFLWSLTYQVSGNMKLNR